MQTVSFASLTEPFVQTYRYDSLYRITEARETNGAATNAAQNWKETFGYDRFGNRTDYAKFTGTTQLTLDNKTFPTINPNTNRFDPNQGYVYDKNGNLISDAEGRSFVFNGENKQAKIIKDGKLVGEYDYNGEGQRVRKRTYDANGALQDTTVFVYSAGKLVAEYSTAAPENPTTRYTATDMLGSPRVIADSEGNVIARRDFKPFGEEISNNTGERTTAAKYGVADNLKQKFTTYQRDEESGLDFAEARMYENRHGRFTAIDPLLASGKCANPQTFNRFVYVLNNPLILSDPEGLQAGFWGFHTTADGFMFRYFESEEQLTDYNEKLINTDFGRQQGLQRKEKWTRGSYIPTGFKEFAVLGDRKIDRITITEDVGTDEQWQAVITDFYSGKELPDLVGIAIKYQNRERNGLINGAVGIGGLLERVTGSNFDLTASNVRQSLDSPFVQGLTISGAARSFGLGRANQPGFGSSSRITTLSTMEDAYAANSTIRNIAGYEVGGNFGRVGQTYNANVFGMYRTRESKNMFAFLRELESEAISAGANRISITGTNIRNPAFLQPSMVNRAARLGYSFGKVSPTTITLTKKLF